MIGHVGEQGAGARGHRGHRVRVRALVRVLGDTKDAELRIHGVEAAVGLVDVYPGDVVAEEFDLVALIEGRRWHHHRQVGLAGGAGEAAGDVVGDAGVLVANADQHELLGQKAAAGVAVVRGLAQAVGDLPEKGVAAVGRAEVQD